MKTEKSLARVGSREVFVSTLSGFSTSLTPRTVSPHPGLCLSVDMACSPLDLELWAGADIGLVHIQFPTAWPIKNVPSFFVECIVVTHTINRYPLVLQQEFLFFWPHLQSIISFSSSIVPTRVQLYDSNF